MQNNPQITLANVTPVARLFTEYNVIAVRKDAPYKTFQDLLKEFKANPSSVKWGGGSKGSIFSDPRHARTQAFLRQVLH